VRQSRSPKLGDILVVTPDGRDRLLGQGDAKYVGMVYKIVLDKWGHKNNVFVSWQQDIAPNYNRAHGYCGMNIHNLRSEFRVIRNGVDIP
jgi:hypothetical protein